MRIWIDADACPRPARDLVVKFALKRSLQVWLVAGQVQTKPAFACVRLIVAPRTRWRCRSNAPTFRWPTAW